MNPTRLTRLAVATLLSLSALGCSAVQGYTLHDDLASLHLQHGDADSIGALDATAPPTNLDDYRHPGDAAGYQTVSIERHPVR